jgi:hypothetical protein
MLSYGHESSDYIIFIHFEENIPLNVCDYTII